MEARIAHPLTRVGRKRFRATWTHREMVTTPLCAGNRTRLIVYPLLFNSETEKHETLRSLESMFSNPSHNEARQSFFWVIADKQRRINKH